MVGIGGSDANMIISGDPERIARLGRKKRGEVAAEDLSSVLPVLLGSWSEAFIRQCYERETGLAISLVGASRVRAEHALRRCTLDGSLRGRAPCSRPSTPAPLPSLTKCSSAICPSSSTTW
jgi:hypothetical protein